jgi:hypothetical protein
LVDVFWGLIMVAESNSEDVYENEGAIASAMSVVAACNVIRATNCSIRDLTAALVALGFGAGELISVYMMQAAGELAHPDVAVIDEIRAQVTGGAE